MRRKRERERERERVREKVRERYYVRPEISNWHENISIPLITSSSVSSISISTTFCRNKCKIRISTQMRDVDRKEQQPPWDLRISWKLQIVFPIARPFPWESERKKISQGKRKLADKLTLFTSCPSIEITTEGRLSKSLAASLFLIQKKIRNVTEFRIIAGWEKFDTWMLFGSQRQISLSVIWK